MVGICVIIMRNVFSILAAFFVGILLCISVLACANDPVEVSNNSNDNLQAQIAALTTKINELETSGTLLAIELISRSIEQIENKLDFGSGINVQLENVISDGTNYDYNVYKEARRTEE